MRLIDKSGNISWGRIILLVIAVMAVITGLLVVARYFGLFGGYAEKPAEILDVDNVQAEYEWFYTQQRAMQAVKANIGSIRNKMSGIEELNGTDKSKWSLAVREEYNQYLDLEMQSTTAYNNKCAEYQARWDNIFHNIVAPKDIPRECDLMQ